MISICSTTYRETVALDIFVRTLIGNASDKNDLEVIIMNDEDYPETCKVLEDLSWEFPQLKYFPYTLHKRAEFFRKQVDFYKRENIFDDDEIRDMYRVLDEYEERKIDKLWFTCCHGYNLSAEQAKGDALILMPSDYIVFFNATDIYHKLKTYYPKGYLGYFDWINFAGLMPEMDTKAELKDDIRKVTQKWLDQFLASKREMVLQQHGARLIDGESFDELGGFDDRWFVRAIPDDLFNEAAKRKLNMPYRLLENIATFNTDPYMGNMRESSSSAHQYLTDFYGIQADVHARFSERIREYLRKKGEIPL